MNSHRTHLPSPVREAIAGFARALERGLPERPLRRLAERPRVSIIVPIFNAPDALAECLRSIEAAGTPTSTEVVLLDDHSSDPRIDGVCQAFAARWPRTLRLRNSRNLGFVSTVNRGMRECARDHDVLLLNSDTVVTPGWLTRMSLAAHLDEETASVCALSNAAGVFTVPTAHGDRELPAGLRPEDAQILLGLASDRARQSVPSTSGFCMLIKRRALERVGYFDARLFHRGYGEENDWNERALGAGLNHRVDDSRFVYHTRGLSFGSSREQLKKRNSRILQALHPQHVDRLRQWEKSDGLETVRARYGALLEHVVGADASDRALLLDGRTTLVVGTDPPRGEWSARERRISVALGRDGIEVDLFGVERARPHERDLTRCLFELAYRWDPHHILAPEPDARARASTIAELFAIELHSAAEDTRAR